MAYLLIVEDDEDLANAAARVLGDAGYEVEIALDTKTAMTSMEERHPDLVILDVMFPENPSAGLELALTVKHQREDLKEIPILMLTAVNTKYPLGLSSGDIDDNWMPVADFLEKPADFDQLLEKVADLLAKA